MPSGLILTHWSLLAIAIISSCFLFYFVASENARHMTPSFSESIEAFAEISTINNANEFNAARPADAKVIKEDSLKGIRNAEKKKVLRDYKKVRKTKSIRTLETSLPSSSMLPSATSFFIQNKERTDVSDVHEETTPFISSSLKHEASSMVNDADKAKIPESVDYNNYNTNANGIQGNQRSNGDNIDSASDNSIVPNKIENDLDKNNDNSNIKDSNKFDQDESLPNIITDIPAVTVTELPLEVLQPMQGSLNAILVDASKKKSEEQDAENRTMEMLEENIKDVPPDDQIVKINDSGGDNASADPIIKTATTAGSGEIIPAQQTTSENESTPTIATPELQQQQKQQENLTADGGSSGGGGATVNLTSEEVPMPVFSEWAQKQMEAAEKQQQAKEQEVVNTIAQKKNLTNGSKKLPSLKMRAKNYASPDCGAKIIASSSDASNTGAVLSSSKDEYMLSPCGNRIWFVVELCEAIQAQKVDLANFELFSSSPKNFTVAVANRFPTRDWSNVGRFLAEDKRTVQSFDLHPHLFGKFVRVDIHSHYSQEHFCPVSLFRVFGTSEIEAFETENHLDEDDIDDFDVEFDSGGVAVDKNNNKKNSENIFKSASDAVLSIVKKAAEVLVKPSSIQNQTTNTQKQLITELSNNLCRTSINGLFSCEQCAPVLVERVNDVVSCRYQQLDNLLALQGLQNDLVKTQICSKRFGVEVKSSSNDCMLLNPLLSASDVKRSYFINLLPEEYIGALCHTLSSTVISAGNRISSTLAGQKDNEMALNLTIEKKLQATGDYKTLNTKDSTKKIIKPKDNTEDSLSNEKVEYTIAPESIQPTTEAPTIAATVHTTKEATQAENEQSTHRIVIETNDENQLPTTPNSLDELSSPPPPVVAPDINIFNVPHVETTEDVQTENQATEESDNSVLKGSGDDSFEQRETELPVLPTTTETPAKNEEEAVANVVWDNLDNMLPTTMSPGQTGQNAQPKLPGSPQSESVFIRLSNRIKTLERNMSLSGQYLEELSRRYKKQVEELQQTLTQQTQNVRNLEEQNRRQREMQQMYEQNNELLRSELDNMALQLHACIVVIIVVGAFVLLLIVISTLFYRAIWHRSKVLQKSEGGSPTKKNNATSSQKKLARRKSFDDLSDHGQEKLRRPSEEVMDILKKHLDVPENQRYRVDKMVQTQPQRKISVCYSGNGNELAALPPRAKNASAKRKGAKNSWSNPNDTRQIDLEQLEQMRGMDLTLAEYQKIMEADKQQKSKSQIANSNQLTNGQGKSKKKNQNLRRQDSAPAQCGANAIKPKKSTKPIDEYGEKLILDEEDLDNFIPTTDLAYNEFMPEGPSGYQTVIDDDDCSVEERNSAGLIQQENSSSNDFNNFREHEPTTKPTKNKKRRSLPSSGFFKSPFGKALKGKSTNGTRDQREMATGSGSGGGLSGSNSTPHSSATSWEWHRLRNSVSSPPTNSGFLRRHSPTGSLDASTLSEIHFPTNSTNNSFRILEEAILSSGEAIDCSPKTNLANSSNVKIMSRSWP